MVVIVTIEGNIGSGKTTFIGQLQNRYKDDPLIVFLKEPVDEWEAIVDSEGHSILGKFYADQEKYAFPFQMMAFISRLALLKDAVQKHPDAIIITERCLYTDKFVFCKMLRDLKKIEDINYQIYEKWFNTFAAEYPVQKAVYINASPATCFERIAKRCRLGEAPISPDYLVLCDKYHNDMMFKLFPESGLSDLVVLDGNVDMDDYPDHLASWVEKVDRFIR
jgi:deoxyadenosine/deoxycytidine kinase